ncbi:pullulanase-type alpha-1,6-glucosidase [Microbulbifer sp. OS29]|uniref:Pullulanase-type alpha-1,6-glucosidase n=1 Tax=Microbulbifer okhotskensis TaxID=2926617 RepID=A0A9X2EM36_9GAMM|nr:pullulanase-type alpha-1,6-glucosidase [Microbulbifer okhotskensis]MCO1333590.1 pullulanase-type alpha-1,6-glucosidase [Microbulbifer okhotskensis]
MPKVRFAGPKQRACLILGALFCFAQPSAWAADTPDPSSVNIPGNLQSQLGCDSDWQPGCAATLLSYDSEDDKWQGSFWVSAGNWEYKAALNNSWDENYGRGGQHGGANISLNLNEAHEIKFVYDHESHWITDNSNSVIATIAGNFQSLLGCLEDWQPSCLRTWMQDLDGDGTYTFVTSELPPGTYEFKVALHEGWDESYGNGGANVSFSVAADNDEIYFAFDSTSKEVTVSSDGFAKGDLSSDKAHWVDANSFAWDIQIQDGDRVKLHYSNSAELKLEDGEVHSDGAVDLAPLSNLPDSVQQKFPHLAAFSAWQLPEQTSLSNLVTQQLALAVYDTDGNLLDATGVQMAGALDDRFYYDGELGAHIGKDNIQIDLWAPTARSVKLHLFSNSDSDTADQLVSMQRDEATGVWHTNIDKQWDRGFYLYEVEVYSYFSRQIETNRVTDPYSLSLSINSGKSQIVNLDDRDLKPRGWDRLHKPQLVQPEDISVYELHVRDFSITDNTVPEMERGTFKAFTRHHSNGMRHLHKLARAGLTHIHLLPAFDFATVNEDRDQQQQTPDLSIYAADSSEQQALVDAVRDSDGFNWGYDPLHYTVPEGSYSTAPDGAARIREFRQMVQGLSHSGLRLVMDVVYNHTSSYGQYQNSVLDKIVPGYYQRRSVEGDVEMSSCCANTASEHAMMEKLMIDSLVTWAQAYKVDSFRFDLMGHHSLDNILKAQAALQSLTSEGDGVDGSAIYLYGEGWNFGEVANDARFVQARQTNMAGSGVGTFNDRLRDSVRGGNPFGGFEEQGFGTGLFTDSNGKFEGEDERATLLTLADKVRVSLAGNLANYPFEDASGNIITGSELVYNGQPTGYTADPQESINYIAAHDNETLFDGVQIKASDNASLRERVRMQAFSNSLVLLGQGVPFIHAGQDFLRSKSMDRDSYNSGDWFNALDFSLASDNWAAGLPVADKNEDSWSLMQPLLANPDLAPKRRHRQWSAALLREQLSIRNSSRLFRLPSEELVKAHLNFLNTGPEQVPGLIVMELSDLQGSVDPRFERIVVLFNSDDEMVEFTSESLRGEHLHKHPRHRRSIDPRLYQVKFDRGSGSFTLPGRTTAVFVQPRHRH